MDDLTATVQLPAARCDRMLYIRASQKAEDDRTSVSRVIRDALEDYLRDYDPEYQNKLMEGAR
jgi:hypothetical protein